MSKVISAAVGILFLSSSALAGTEPPSILRGRPALVSRLYQCKSSGLSKNTESPKISLQIMGKHPEIAFLKGLNAEQLDYFAEVKDDLSPAVPGTVYEKFGSAQTSGAAMVLSKDPPSRLRVTSHSKSLHLEVDAAGKKQHLECIRN